MAGSLLSTVKNLVIVASVAAVLILTLAFSQEKEFDNSSESSASRILSQWLDPKTVEAKAHKRAETFFFARDGDTQGLFKPTEVIVEIVNPKRKGYSVTIVSEGRYTGVATFVGIDISTGNNVYSWIPSFPDDSYQILVHELNGEISPGEKGSPLIHPSPLQFSIQLADVQNANDHFNAVLKERLSMPPCQSIEERFDGYSRWNGDWIGPETKLDVGKIRTGWGFLPSREMGCKIETFSKEDLLSIPEKKSIYVIGTSRERGVFLSLVDMLLEPKEKEHFGDSVVGQCWGRAVVEKGNMKVSYQDFRANSFEQPDDLGAIQCHNDKVVRGGLQSNGSMLGNATAFWNELFEDETMWPDVIYLLSGHKTNDFNFEAHTLSFAQNIPPSWRGTLIIGDYEFNAKRAGLDRNRQGYQDALIKMLDVISDPRVRWLDGEGISTEQRMYAERGEEQVSLSQHFHHLCEENNLYIPSGERMSSDVMRVCSNITEIVAQLLVGHALGPKDAFHKAVSQYPAKDKPDMTLTVCHDCPKELLPFHITPHPVLTCTTGKFHPRTKEEMDNVVVSKDSPPQKCPCLSQSVDYSFSSQSDVIHVRECKSAY